MDKEKLKKCEEEREEYLNGWKRARADLINYKRDESERLQEMEGRGADRVVRELITVMDGFEEGVRETKDEGMRIVYGELVRALGRCGVKEICPGEGDRFNPKEHEATGETESDAPEGTVARVERKGYEREGAVLRAAQVILSKSRKSQKNNQ